MNTNRHELFFHKQKHRLTKPILMQRPLFFGNTVHISVSLDKRCPNYLHTPATVSTLHFKCLLNCQEKAPTIRFLTFSHNVGQTTVRNNLLVFPCNCSYFSAFVLISHVNRRSIYLFIFGFTTFSNYFPNVRKYSVKMYISMRKGQGDIFYNFVCVLNISSHQQPESYGEGTYVLSLIRRTGGQGSVLLDTRRKLSDKSWLSSFYLSTVFHGIHIHMI